MTTVGKTVASIIKGLITGLIYYAVFALILPGTLSHMLNTGIELVEPHLPLLLICVFTALSTLSYLLKPFIGIVFHALSILVGILLITSTAGPGLIKAPLATGEDNIEVYIDIMPLLLVILGIITAWGITGILEKLVKEDE
ncbi:MAG: hypothetical protein QXP97_06585 [Desulfurococcus sp.]|jgi:hypothetical protein|uniref:hypothetical protein n=1 Tax=Desulfurococcus sp. TaxID=51678 RepID=UPI00316380E0